MCLLLLCLLYPTIYLCQKRINYPQFFQGIFLCSHFSDQAYILSSQTRRKWKFSIILKSLNIVFKSILKLKFCFNQLHDKAYSQCYQGLDYILSYTSSVEIVSLYFIFANSKLYFWNWRYGLVVRSACCCYRTRDYSSIPRLQAQQQTQEIKIYRI